VHTLIHTHTHALIHTHIYTNTCALIHTYALTHVHAGKHGFGGNKKDEGDDKKAILITGPPGVGKSSAARILAREAGYDVVEMNAR
jgi:DNA polymerase III delta prime subunit